MPFALKAAAHKLRAQQKKLHGGEGIEAVSNAEEHWEDLHERRQENAIATAGAGYVPVPLLSGSGLVRSGRAPEPRTKKPEPRKSSWEIAHSEATVAALALSKCSLFYSAAV